ncbi:HAMP domain-containing sensor histidine kinase [Streptomyces sp. SID13031]|uniref:sensor histidine kinase n=1 Tax=Streptomyces sp. SID13031 TaxID=2706046 RepID=UPI0013C8337F|nr:HAMP domain-containing sensor histidine kinase [Streptomyces sp. SID13031]NEA31379.1 HAMP domain-containing histidine kinase [Streptomyces sp. SID13031]
MTLRRRFGLRDRVMLAYGLLALGLSGVLALVTWSVVSSYLTDQRISSAIVETSDNAATLHYALYGLTASCGPVRRLNAEPECGTIDSLTSTEVMNLVEALPSTDSAAMLMRYDSAWYTMSASADQVPTDMVETARNGLEVHRRIEVGGNQVLAVGVALGRPGEAFFELHPLNRLDNTLRTLKLTLILAAIVTALLGLAVGRLASTVALRPLAKLTSVAAAVARGRLDARLEAENDPDLGGLARSFNQTAAALEKRVVADARFAGDISHELRTPLMTMMNSMQLIQNHRAELPGSVREPLELLGDDLDRFRQLVIDLLEISRDDGGDQGTRETVRIGDLVRAAADATAGREITDVAPDAADLTMEADKRRLERVIANLVDNAEQHAGGCKGVSVRAGGKGVIIFVDDAGPGVPEANRERIFERFGRGNTSPDSRTDTQRGGIGLGLAIVARHVEWHHGTIQVKDRPEGGARFIIELPAKNP